MRTKEELQEDLKLYAGKFDEIKTKIDDLILKKWLYNQYYLCGYLQRYIEDINLYSDLYFKTINEDSTNLPYDYEYYIVRFVCYVDCDGRLAIDKQNRYLSSKFENNDII